jgi:hypothetical protein
MHCGDAYDNLFLLSKQNKMTSIELLFKKLWEEPKDKLTWNSIFEQAKEMHKQEMSDSYKDGWMSCEKWFEDKELDDHIVDTNEMVEISDNEIFEGILKHCSIQHDRILAEVNAMIDGAKWYREQLKERK